MKKRLFTIAVTLICLISLISAAVTNSVYAGTDISGVSDTDTSDASDTEASDISDEEISSEPVISRTRLTLKPGKHWRLKVTGNTGRVAWSSKNEEVATVSRNGYITAVAEGTTRIYARVDGKKLSCKLKVEAVKKVKLVAVGDNLYHEAIINSGRKSDGTINYDGIYKNLRKDIKAADVAIINQEVLLTADSERWSGHPEFASPLEAGEAVVKAGFNVITCASNHSYDKGAAILTENVKYWKSKEKDGVVMVGIYNSQKDYDTIAVKEYNGIKIAFLNYTYGVNGHRPDSDHAYMIKFTSEKLIKSEIEKAKKLADVVIVLPHWGTEYQLAPTDSQKALAKKIAEWGADIIIGTHPHVVEPLRFIKTSDGRRVPCYYSLGNLVGNYIDWYKPMLEGMAELTITKWNGEVKIKNAKLTPLVCDIKLSSGAGYAYTVYKLADYTEEMANKHVNNRSGRAYRSHFTAKELNTLFDDIMSGDIDKYEDKK